MRVAVGFDNGGRAVVVVVLAGGRSRLKHGPQSWNSKEVGFIAVKIGESLHSDLSLTSKQWTSRESSDDEDWSDGGSSEI